VSSVMWRSVWVEIVLKITKQRTYKTYFRPSSTQTVEASTTMQVKENGYLQDFFFGNLAFPLRSKDIATF